MEIPLFTGEIFGDGVNLPFGNEQISQSSYLSNDGFIAILMNLMNENMKKILKEPNLPSKLSEEATSLNIDEFYNISDETEKNSNKNIEVSDEDLKKINAVIVVILNALNLIKNKNDNFITNESLEIALNNDSIVDWHNLIKPIAEELEAEKVRKIYLSLKADSSELISDFEETIKNLPSKDIIQKIPQNVDSDLYKKVVSRIDTKELSNKNENISNISINQLTSKDSKENNTELETSSNFLNNQNKSDELNLCETKDIKYVLRDIPLSESRQTLSTFLDKNLQIEETISKTKVLNQESSNDIDELRINFSKIDHSTIRFEIKPIGIGACDIELTLENGVVNAHILASESVGKVFFDNHLSNILNNLLKDGLNVGKFSVSLGDRSGDSNNEKDRDNQKTVKLIEELNSLDSHHKNNLISIFV